MCDAPTGVGYPYLPKIFRKIVFDTSVDHPGKRVIRKLIGHKFISINNIKDIYLPVRSGVKP